MCRQYEYHSRYYQQIVGISKRCFHYADLVRAQVPGGIPDQEYAEAKKKNILKDVKNNFTHVIFW